MSLGYQYDTVKSTSVTSPLSFSSDHVFSEALDRRVSAHDGNEPSGLFALHHVYHELLASECEFHGEFVAMNGNLWALSQQKRYDKYDLNRLWTPGPCTRGLRKIILDLSRPV
jgi:hypothetical protein